MRRVDRMYADMNKLRRAIQSEGSPAIQDAWDRVVECITALSLRDDATTEGQNDG